MIWFKIVPLGGTHACHLAPLMRPGVYNGETTTITLLNGYSIKLILMILFFIISDQCNCQHSSGKLSFSEDSM